MRPLLALFYAALCCTSTVVLVRTAEFHGAVTQKAYIALDTGYTKQFCIGNKTLNAAATELGTGYFNPQCVQNAGNDNYIYFTVDADATQTYAGGENEPVFILIVDAFCYATSSTNYPKSGTLGTDFTKKTIEDLDMTEAGERLALPKLQAAYANWIAGGHKCDGKKSPPTTNPSNHDPSKKNPSKKKKPPH